MGSLSFTLARSISDSSATPVIGLLIEYNRQIVWSSSAVPVSRSIVPTVERNAS